MFKEIFRFELTNSLKRPMVYIFALISFIMVFMAAVSDTVQIGGANDAIFINAPHVIMKTTLVMSLLGVFMTTAFMNSSMLKDYRYKFDGLLFSTSISKLGYLGGKFLSTYLLSLIPFVGVLLAMALAGVVGIVDPENVGGISLSHYVNTFFGAVVPNVFIICCVIMSLCALLKSNMYSFIGAIGFVILYLMMGSFAGSLDNESIAILSDPLGMSSYDILTKYWTIEEKNTLMIEMSGFWLVNRAIWMSVGLLLLVMTYMGFSFSKKKSGINMKLENEEETGILQPIFQKVAPIPHAAFSDNTRTQIALFFHHAWTETKGILKSTPFIILTLLSILNMSGSISSMDDVYGTGNHPVTYLMVSAIRGTLYLFLISVLMYYAGALIWKERDNKMNELIDAAPFPSWIPYLSKMTALLTITFATLCLGIVCGMVAQALKGYTHFELGVYIKELLVLDFIKFGGLIALAMFIQTIVNNKYLGYFTFIIAIVVLKFGPQAFEISSNMIAFGNTPSYTYSDMNGWSLYDTGLIWFNTYWTLVAVMITVLGIVFWVRGLENSWSARWSFAKARYSGKLAMTMSVVGVIWFCTTGFLYYQTQVINEIENEDLIVQRQVGYERTYKQYEHIAQPRITAVDYNIDMYPDDRSFTSIARMTVINKTDEEISNIHFSLQEGYDISIEIENAEQILCDTDLDYQIFKLEKPLSPGAQQEIVINAGYAAIGIENEVSNTDIVENGTFLSNFKFMPAIGYAPSREVSDAKDREEHALGFKPSQAKLHEGCSASCKNTYISQDADWVHVTSTISTGADQIAIAPGSLVNSWEEEGRKYYKYELEEKVLNFYSFISGRYQVARDVWTSRDDQEVNLEVYYHKGHEYNVDKMLASLKNSLTYFTDNYSAYPHNEARIIEFPRYASFAQAFPGTMPYSESMGFIANLQEEHSIDMVYYYVAHEMAHQWWAHQVIGADVQGATMLSESFAQYSALMVMKQQYGADKMKQFMRYEMDGYLRGRSKEDDRELPLMFNENQQYIHYKKGSVVMYALQEYIGEDKINEALRTFAEAKAYQEAPYTNTLEFIDFLSAVTPDSLNYLITDMVASITLYSNETTSGRYRKLENGQYEVSLDVIVEKYRADSLGRETLIPHDDYIDIGVFSEEIPEGERYGRPILVKRVKISERENTYTIIVDEEPHTAGIDPNYLLVDRFPQDNVKVLELVE